MSATHTFGHVQPLEPRRLLAHAAAATTSAPVTAVYDPASYSLVLTGTAGNDRFRVASVPGAYKVVVVPLDDPAESFIFPAGAGGIVNVLVIDGAGGNDRIELDASLRPAVTLRGGDGRDTLVGGGRLSNLIEGNRGSDSITGSDQGDIIVGGGGNDTVDGAGGDDCVRGSEGNDSVLGGPGHDVLTGGEGDDTLLGGAAGDGPDQITSGGGYDFVAADSAQDTTDPLAPGDTDATPDDLVLHDLFASLASVTRRRTLAVNGVDRFPVMQLDYSNWPWPFEGEYIGVWTGGRFQPIASDLTSKLTLKTVTTGPAFVPYYVIKIRQRPDGPTLGDVRLFIPHNDVRRAFMQAAPDTPSVLSTEVSLPQTLSGSNFPDYLQGEGLSELRGNGGDGSDTYRTRGDIFAVPNGVDTILGNGAEDHWRTRDPQDVFEPDPQQVPLAQA